MDPNTELNNQIDDQVDGTEETELEEDAAANQATVASKPTISRSELMRTMVAYATKMGPEELADFVGRIGNAEDITVQDAQISPTISGDEKNKASINSAGKPSAPMVSVKEDLALVFGSENLSEDFKTRAEALFEAAVGMRVDLELTRLQEEMEVKLDEQVESITEELLENVDTYLNYAVSQWIAENKLAIDKGLRAEVAESFLAGLKDLFDEHYVDIPEDKEDIVESLATKVAELEAIVEEVTAVNEDLSKQVNESAVSQIKESLANDLTDVQKEKFAKLTEVVEYASAEEFQKKASIIKETYFKTVSESGSRTSDVLLNEVVEEPARSPTAGLEPDIARYMDSISKIAKK